MTNEDDPADSLLVGEDARLTRLATICVAFPEVEREYMGVHTRFVVRKKTFAYFLSDHHGDGIVLFCVKKGSRREQRVDRLGP